MTKNIEVLKKEKLLECLDYIRNFIEEMPAQKTCVSCLNWDHDKNGCKVSNLQTPPPHVQKNGCSSWEIWDFIPF